MRSCNTSRFSRGGYRIQTWSVLCFLVLQLLLPNTSFAQKSVKQIREKAASEGSVRVLVRLKIDNLGALTTSSAQFVTSHSSAASSLNPDVQLRNSIAQGAAVLESELSGKGLAAPSQTQSTSSYEIKHTYAVVPYVLMNVSADTLDALAASSLVDSIQEDTLVGLPADEDTQSFTALKSSLSSSDELDSPQLYSSPTLIGADSAWTSGYTGSSWNVVIIDSGIRSSHQFFTGKTITEACFSQESHCPNSLQEMYGTGAAAHHSSAYSGWDHGTHVSGITAGKYGSLSGIAKDADIIALQVFSRFIVSNVPKVLSWSSDQLKALEYTYSLRNSKNISSINMSLGGGSYSSACDSSNALTEIITRLKDVNIPTIIASGNNGYCDYISAPSCVSSAVSVGAASKSDQEASFNNWSATLLDVFAPGVSILSSTGSSTGSYESWNGTSMATPHVTGAWALIKSALPSASVDEVLAAFQATGVAVTTTCTSGGSKKRINVSEAITLLQGTTAALQLISPNGSESVQRGSSYEIRWSSSGSVGNVRLEYSSDNGGSWSDIIASTENDGSYYWSVPTSTTSQALIRISEASDSDPTDSSNATFTINDFPEIQVSGNSVEIVNGEYGWLSSNDTDFGEVTSGSYAEQTFTVSNIGQAALTLTTPITLTAGTSFSIVSQPQATLGIGESTTFTIRYTASCATTNSLFSDLVTLSNNDSNENPYTFVVAGVCVLPTIGITDVTNGQTIAKGDSSPSTSDSTDFGTALLSGSYIEKSFKITNSGKGQLTLSVPSILNSSYFQLINTPASSLAYGENTTFTIRYLPSTAGTQTATVSIQNSTLADNPFTFAISATALNAAIQVLGNSQSVPSGSTITSTANKTEFGALAPGDSAEHEFVISNSGTYALQIAAVALEGDSEFTLPLGPASTISAGSTSTFRVRYAPASLGEHSATVRITHSASGTPYTFVLGGEGSDNLLSVTGESRGIATGDSQPSLEDGTNFGEVTIGNEKEQAFVISNVGSETLSLANFQIAGSGDFVVVDNTAQSIAPGDSFTLRIVFSAKVRGEEQGVVSFSTNTTPAAYSFSVSAKAVPARGTTVCADWNGFFQGSLYNVMEHVNTSNTQLTITSILYSLAGAPQSITEFVVPPQGEFDILAHDMLGWSRESYGQICSSHTGDVGDLDGRMVYYKQNSQGSDFEFAFALDFTEGVAGEQFLPFNTMQPSLAPEDASKPVANWIGITNQNSTFQAGTLYFYDEQGALLAEEIAWLEPSTRQDFSAHQFGQNRVGLVRWVPASTDAKFTVRNYRYYYATENINDATFTSALQIEGDQGTSRTLGLPLDTEGKDSVLEVANPNAEEIAVTIRVYTSEGALASTSVVGLAAHQSIHVVATAILGTTQKGYAEIEPQATKPISASAIYYTRKANAGIKNVYGIPARASLGQVIKGSYNTYLGQSCTLMLTNSGENSNQVSLSLVRADGTPVAENINLTIPAKGSYFYDLCALESADSYGIATLTAANENQVTGTILRQGRNNRYVFPVPMRQ